MHLLQTVTPNHEPSETYLVAVPPKKTAEPRPVKTRLPGCEPAERQILRGSWLNKVEVWISILQGQSLNRGRSASTGRSVHIFAYRVRKFGARPIEFEKGMAGIVVPSRDKLPAVIDTLISAVRAGELDELFNQAAKTVSIGKARKAA
jgi:hypothetical protein